MDLNAKIEFKDIDFNKIKSFLDTFDGEFMNSLVGNKSLQRFWSTVINN